MYRSHTIRDGICQMWLFSLWPYLTLLCLRQLYLDGIDNKTRLPSCGEILEDIVCRAGSRHLRTQLGLNLPVRFAAVKYFAARWEASQPNFTLGPQKARLYEKDITAIIAGYFVISLQLWNVLLFCCAEWSYNPASSYCKHHTIEWGVWWVSYGNQKVSHIMIQTETNKN